MVTFLSDQNTEEQIISSLDILTEDIRALRKSVKSIKDTVGSLQEVSQDTLSVQKDTLKVIESINDRLSALENSDKT